MVNRSPEEASRRFVALFVLDPAQRRLRGAREVLAPRHQVARALSAVGLGADDVRRIQEFSGQRQSQLALKLQRNLLLREQLRPSGEFCAGSQAAQWIRHLEHALVS